MRWGYFILFLATTAPAAAEVMDKEPGLGAIWTSALVIAALAFAAGRLNPLLAVGVLFLSLYAGNWAVYALSEFDNPTKYRAILHEAGRSYIVQTQSACALELLGAAVGSAMWLRQRRTRWRARRAEPARR
jgi:hypothetical protein